MARFSVCAGAVILALISSSAIASNETDDDAQPIKTEAMKLPQTEQRVCRYEQAIGSHMTRRVCRTRSQIDSEREVARDLIEEIGNAASTNLGSQEGR